MVCDQPLDRAAPARRPTYLTTRARPRRGEAPLDEARQHVVDALPRHAGQAGDLRAVDDPRRISARYAFASYLVRPRLVNRSITRPRLVNHPSWCQFSRGSSGSTITKTVRPWECETNSTGRTPDLLAWAGLTEAAREKDREVVRAIPELLRLGRVWRHPRPLTRELVARGTRRNDNTLMGAGSTTQLPSIPVRVPWRKPKLRIFINYRRDDSAGYANSIYQSLVARFGADQVFMDVDTIAPGKNFDQRIDQTLSTCDVVVAVIGREWLTASHGRGPRLESPDDYVRLELERAIDRNIPLVPTLVHGADLPNADQLPQPLRPLLKRQAIELRNTSWKADVDRMTKAFEELARELRNSAGSADVADLLTKALSHVQRVPRRARTISLVLLAALVIALLGIGFTIHWLLIAVALAAIVWVIAAFAGSAR